MDIQRTRKETTNPHHKPRNWFASKENILISVPYIAGLCEEFLGIFCYTNEQLIFKGTKTLNSMPIHPKDKILLHIKLNIYYKGSSPKESSIDLIMLIPADV